MHLHFLFPDLPESQPNGVTMNLIPWRKPHSVDGELFRLRSFVDQVFDRFSREPFGHASTAETSWRPALDVSETDTEITVRAEVPGVDPKDLDIAVNGSMLSIGGEKSACDEREGEDWWQCERRFGSFKRVLELPASADPDKVTADGENGIVTVRIAKKPGARTRQIEVRAGHGGGHPEARPARKVAVNA
jgi:HSP20 family protein